MNLHINYNYLFYDHYYSLRLNRLSFCNIPGNYFNSKTHRPKLFHQKSKHRKFVQKKHKKFNNIKFSRASTAQTFNFFTFLLQCTGTVPYSHIKSRETSVCVYTARLRKRVLLSDKLPQTN